MGFDCLVVLSTIYGRRKRKIVFLYGYVGFFSLIRPFLGLDYLMRLVLFLSGTDLFVEWAGALSKSMLRSDRLETRDWRLDAFPSGDSAELLCTAPDAAAGW